MGDSLNLKNVPSQPGEDTWKFINDLKAPMWTKHVWKTTSPDPQQAELSGGVHVKVGFSDPKRRLETVYEDLRCFLAAGGILSDNGGYMIETVPLPDLKGESFRLEIDPKVCRILAEDVEGIRRGIFHLEDEMLRLRAPYLPLGTKIEFGKKLVGGDYWLSTPGPSQSFERQAKIARENGTQVSAKIQTGTSHEVASIPYVPVPSMIYRKFSSMRSLGVTHTMLGWYFGNYPGLMIKAAGELSFEPFPKDEDTFLHQLASIYWKEEDVSRVVEAWKNFAEGYGNYPLQNMMGYYGPMHDGPDWPLLLKPLDAPLSPTWQIGSSATLKSWPPSGDRIGECLWSGGDQIGNNDEWIDLDMKAMRSQKDDRATKHLSNSKEIFLKLLEISRSLNEELVTKCIKERDYEELDLYILRSLIQK